MALRSARKGPAMSDAAGTATRRTRPRRRGRRIVVVDDHHLFRAGVKRRALRPLRGRRRGRRSGSGARRRSPRRGPTWCCWTSTCPTGAASPCSRACAAAGGRPARGAGAVGVRRRRGRRADDPRRGARLRDQDDRHRGAGGRDRAGGGGDAYFSPRLAAFVLQAFSTPVQAEASEPGLESLTAREREVLHHLARGYAYKQIACGLASARGRSSPTSARCCASCSSAPATRWRTGRRPAASSSPSPRSRARAA